MIKLLFPLFICACNPHVGPQNGTWNYDAQKNIKMTLVDSIIIPLTLPKYISDLSLENEKLFFTYSKSDSSGYIASQELGVIDLNSFEFKSRSLGQNRFGQPLDVMAFSLKNDTIYLISGSNKEIRLFDSKLQLVETIKFGLPSDTMFVDKSLLWIPKPSSFIIGVDFFEKFDYYNPLVKVNKGGLSDYLHDKLNLKFINNNFRDYPKVQYCECNLKLAIFPQHEPFFFIYNYEKSNLIQFELPDEVVVDEDPTLNQVKNIAQARKRNYQKNTAFLWCLYNERSIKLLQRIVDPTGEANFEYRIYQLDLEKNIVLKSNAISFAKSNYLIQTFSDQNSLFILDGNRLYQYVFE